MSKDRAIQQLKEIEQRAKKLLNAVRMLPELPDYAKLWSTETELRIHIPYDQSKMASLHNWLGSAGYQPTGCEFTADDGHKFISYHSDNYIIIIITMIANDEDATCQLERVGTREIPIYEVVCS